MSEASNPLAMLTNVPNAIASVIVTRKTLHAQHVIAERTKWRDKIREAIEQAFTQKSASGWYSLWLTLKVNTNPMDPNDLEIIDLARTLSKKGHDETLENQLLDRLALLLKHDWQRTKREAGEDMLPPTRVKYEDYQQWKLSGMPARRCWSGQQPAA